METLETLRSLGGNSKTPKPSLKKPAIEELETVSSIVEDDKRTVPGKRWAFTAFNCDYSKLWDSIPDTYMSNIKEYVMAQEICPDTGTKHIQGFIETHNKIRPSEYFKTKHSRYFKAKGTNEDNYLYCRKLRAEDKVPNEIWKSNMKIPRIPRKLIDPMNGITPKYWQKEILDIINTVPDNRKIYWYWETEGAKGKSTLAKHICINHQALAVGGKGNDIKYAVAQYLQENELDVLIYDVPRNIGNLVSYSSIEEIKNGLMFSNKYESGMVVFNPPHIIIFSNFAPDESKLSGDRWVIHNISE